jgi:hypothetical protein
MKAGDIFCSTLSDVIYLSLPLEVFHRTHNYTPYSCHPLVCYADHRVAYFSSENKALCKNLMCKPLFKDIIGDNNEIISLTGK